MHVWLRWPENPAAFGRLCVETISMQLLLFRQGSQPPSGGCVLKRLRRRCRSCLPCQPPSGGCVLKLLVGLAFNLGCAQPPSGGCVLKLAVQFCSLITPKPAAFGRLCVETTVKFRQLSLPVPAAFGRLCVETGFCAPPLPPHGNQPPSGGCVLKHCKSDYRW